VNFQIFRLLFAKAFQEIKIYIRIFHYIVDYTHFLSI
jgi:hypothetical protein